jgi:hypothetical protein
MFNEANTVEQMILDACQGLGWQFVPGPRLPRQAADACEPTALAAGFTRWSHSSGIKYRTRKRPTLARAAHWGCEFSRQRRENSAFASAHQEWNR